jgi:hypothetical protein
MNWINIDRDILEIVYFITAGPLLLIVASFGLVQLVIAKQQIKFSKESAKTAAKREAFKLTAEQCNIFAEKIIPLYTIFCDQLGSKPFYKRLTIEFVNNERVLVIGGNSTETEKADFLEALNASKHVAISNSLEAFAMYFVSGVGSEELAYNSTGYAFCGIIDDFTPLLKASFNQGKYPNINHLYGIWKKRQKSDELKKKKDEIEKQLSLNMQESIQHIGY